MAELPVFCVEGAGFIPDWKQGHNDMPCKLKQLLKAYGDQLVCVRYRYDKARQKRIKTVALIVDEQDRIPAVTIPADRRVGLKIAFGESELGEQIKRAVGYWNPEHKGLDAHLSQGAADGFGAKKGG